MNRHRCSGFTASHVTFRTVCVTVGAVVASLCGAALFVSASTSIDQLGADIDGEAERDRFGDSVSLSSDGTIIAIGAEQNDGTAKNAGHVRVYEWNGSAWQQKGADIDGEALEDYLGSSVSLSSDGTILAIGADGNDGTTTNAGHVRVYEWNGSAWQQKGADIDGEGLRDRSGSSVSLSSDGTILAIGAQGNASNTGHVRVYEWNSGTSSWDQKGADIDGEALYDVSGASVSLSSDGTILAIGARGNDENGSNAGHVRVYEWNGSAWTQKGADIDGEAAGDRSGHSVSLSSDGTILAIGADSNDGNGTFAGHVRVYEWNSGTSSWDQKGADIDGEAADDQSGYSVSLSSDGTILAIGATGNDGNGNDAGHVRVYEWNSGTSSWDQKGADIDGEAAGDKSGRSVSLSSDGTKLAVGAPFNEANGIDSGHVRVYSITTSSPTTSTTTTTTISTPSASGPRVPGQVPPWPVAILNVDGTVTVSWQAPFDDGNGPITGYRVTSSPTGGSCSTTGLTCVIAGLDPNVDYLFEVFASNSDGEGPGRLTQQSIRIVPQTPATTEPTAPQLLPVTPATPQPLPETGTDDDLVMWSMLLAAFGTLITLATRRRTTSPERPT